MRFNTDYDSCVARDIIGRACDWRMSEVMRQLQDRARAQRDYAAMMKGSIRDNSENLADACDVAYATIEAWQYGQLNTMSRETILDLVDELVRRFVIKKEVYLVACNVLAVPRDLRAIIFART